MKSVFRLLPFLFLLGLSAYLPGVRAETCRANIGQTTVNIPNIKYLPTLPVNTQMTSAMADNGSGIPFSCDLQLPTASAKRIVYKQLKTGGAPVVINGQHVYPSAIDGIGQLSGRSARRTSYVVWALAGEEATWSWWAMAMRAAENPASLPAAPQPGRSNSSTPLQPALPCTASTPASRAMPSPSPAASRWPAACTLPAVTCSQ